LIDKKKAPIHSIGEGLFSWSLVMLQHDSDRVCRLTFKPQHLQVTGRFQFILSTVSLFWLTSYIISQKFHLSSIF